MVLQLPFYSIHSLNSNNQFMGNITSFANCCCAACVDLDVDNGLWKINATCTEYMYINCIAV